MRMSLPRTSSGYALGPDDGEALWFNGGLGLSTQRRTSSSSCSRARFASGTVTMVIEGTAGSLAYSPRGISHAFHVDSPEARMLLFFGPASVEGFFREAGTPARSFGPPPAGEPVPDRDTLIEIMSRYSQTVVGPPLPPKG
jgi:hypothetical protein